jgi:ABC-2 type transport system permease protein
MKAEVVRTFIIMRRYWFATLTSMAIGYGMLMGMIFGFMHYGDQAAELLAAEATSKALGFIIGMFAFGIVGMFTQGLQGMARTGELEQVCMSPHGLITNFLARSMVGAINSILTLSILLFLVARTLKGDLHAAPGPVVILLALTYFNLIGFGFMAGGLALVFKQTGQVAMFVRLGLLAIAFWATADKISGLHPFAQWVAHILPVTDAAVCLKLVLIEGIGIRIVYDPAYSVFFYGLLANCLIWNGLGLICFRFMENWSRDKGTLGAY